MADQITVTLNVGGNELTTRSYTNSCAPMWQAAGADLVTFDGQRALYILPSLMDAVASMQFDPAYYETFNPTDGSGDYAGCLGFLTGLVEDCNHHPKAIVRIS